MSEPESSPGSDASSASHGEEFDASQLPPADLSTIVRLFSTQAMAALGLIPGPDGQATRRLPIARHFIDLIDVLQQKTRAAADAGESRMMDEALHELRMAFVEISRRAS